MASDNAVGIGVVMRRFATPIYAVCMLCILAPPLDLILSLPSVDPSNVMWRFGALGLITGAVVFPLLGLLIALVTAHVCGHRWVHRLLVAAAAVATAGLFVALGLFTLDAVQVRGEIPANRLRRFDITVIKAILLQIAQLATVISLLWVSIRVARSRPRTTEDPESTLVGSGGRTLSSRRG